MTTDVIHNTEPLSAAELQEIEQFTDALWMEHGLSKNTLTAYRNDLAGETGPAPADRAATGSARLSLGARCRRCQAQNHRTAGVIHAALLSLSGP